MREISLVEKVWIRTFGCFPFLYGREAFDFFKAVNAEKHHFFVVFLVVFHSYFSYSINHYKTVTYLPTYIIPNLSEISIGEIKNGVLHILYTKNSVCICTNDTIILQINYTGSIIAIKQLTIRIISTSKRL